MPCFRLAPIPVSPVPKHAITSFRVTAERCRKQRETGQATHILCEADRRIPTMPSAAAFMLLVMPAEQSLAQGKASGSCCVPQHTKFKPPCRRISTRQLTGAPPKARLMLVLHLAAHQLQSRGLIQCDTNRCNSSCQWNTALPKARQVLVPRPAEPRLHATLAADLHTPADRSTAQDKASACAAPRSTSTSNQSTHPVRCQPLQPIMPVEHRFAQGKARQVLVLRPAERRVQATLAADLHPPAD